MMSQKVSIKKGKGISLTNQILIATAIGLILGVLIGPKIAPIKVIGDVFLRLVLMSVPVIILGAVAEAVGQISPKDLGKLGFKMFSWFFGSTIIAAALGVLAAFIFKPGIGVTAMELSTNIVSHNQSVTDIITNFFSNNIIASLANGNMMQVIIFALLLGIAISTYVDKTGDKSLLNLIGTLNKTILIIITMVMKLAPLGVGSLLAWVAGTMGFAVIIPLLKYLGTILIATSIVMVLLVIATSIVVKVNPFKLAIKIVPMSLMAASTTSSAMSLAIKMKDSEEKLGVSKRISNLVNPLGMVLNSAGQALFLSIASIMMIQFFNLDFSFGKIVQVVILSTLACMGTLAVPGGALVIFAGLMPSLGLPPEGIALIAGVDWFRGAITTVPNVAGDALISLIIAYGEDEFNRNVFDGTEVIESIE